MSDPNYEEEPGVVEEREDCAKLVRAAGCLCHLIPQDPKQVRLKLPRKEHDPRCPIALAGSIEGRGR